MPCSHYSGPCTLIVALIDPVKGALTLIIKAPILDGDVGVEAGVSGIWAWSVAILNPYKKLNF